MLTDSRIDFEGVIFDFDNTLVDTASTIRDAYGAVFSKIASDFNVDYGSLLTASDIVQAEKMKELALSRKSYDHANWIPDIAFSAGVDIGDKADEYRQLFYSFVINNPRFSNETADILKELKEKGKKLALLSERDSVPGMKLERIKKVPFYTYFDKVAIAGETFPYRKATDGPKPFLATAGLIGIKTQDIVMVGDRPDLDIQNAKEAGMKAILFTGYSDSKEFTKYQPDLVAREINDLRKFIL